MTDEAGRCMAIAVAQDAVQQSDLKATAGQKLRELQGFLDEASFNGLYQSYKQQIDFIMT